jgi:hypothetical protein
MHVICLTIVDASDTGGRVDHEACKATLAKRLPRLPLLSRKLVLNPLGLSRPHWVPDPEFVFRNPVDRYKSSILDRCARRDADDPGNPAQEKRKDLPS